MLTRSLSSKPKSKRELQEVPKLFTCTHI